MGTLSLQCPFCCNETFSSRESLKSHILNVWNNLSCSHCSVKFENVFQFTEHLDTECLPASRGLKNDKPVQSEQNVDPEPMEEDPPHNDSGDQGVETNGPEPETDKNEDGVSYMCVMCNVHFKSIEEHLDKFHQGEEVILETEETENESENIYEGEDSDFVEFPEAGNFELSNEPIDNDELNKAEDEQQYLDHQELSLTKKPSKPWSQHKSNIPPMTENYMIENGKVKKITEEEAAEISDRNAIIQIHQCPKCLLQFPKLDHYIKHSCIQKSGKKYKCKDCSATFQSHQSLSAHIRTHLNPNETPSKVITLGPHTCESCNTMFPSFKSLRLHRRMHDPQKVKPIESPVSAQTDESGEKVRQMFVCHICNNTYDVEYEEAHMQFHTEEDNFYCATCNRKFLTKENLEMHMKAHTNTKKFICSYCKKPFLTYESLHEHVTNQCQKRQYECHFCGRRFSRPCEKVKHERIHTGEKPHICQICGKAFRVSYCLTLHMRTHSGSRPYECPHCKKRFKSHSVYNHHLLIHSDVRAYKCPYCPKAFKTSVQLAGHKNSHIKPFSCTECNRPFASLYAVRAHMETHKKENNLKFDCWICGATYARAFALKDHMKSQHVNDGEEILVDMDSVETENAETKFVPEEEYVENEELKLE